MEDWLGCIWEYRPGALSEPQNMLALGAFCDTVSDRIRYRLKNKNTDLVIIPNGMTSQLASLDVSACLQIYDTWLNKDNHIDT
jgi:hypothetical protein